MPAGVVVGAGAGVGAAIARRLGAEGVTIGAVAPSEASLVDGLAGVAGDQALGLIADPIDEFALPRALEVIVARFGVPDLLVAITHEDAAAVVGAITAAAHLAPAMADAGRGTLVLVGDRHGPARALACLLLAAFERCGLHAGAVTTTSDPEAVAEECWRLHVEHLPPPPRENSE